MLHSSALALLEIFLPEEIFALGPLFLFFVVIAFFSNCFVS